MDQTDKILIVHDTSHPEFNRELMKWVLDFRNDITSVFNRISRKDRKFVLSTDLAHDQNNIPVLRLDEFDFFICVISQDLIEPTYLFVQINNILNFFSSSGNQEQEMRVINILLQKSPEKPDQIMPDGIKAFMFYYESTIGIFDKGRPMGRQDREYWLKLTDVAEMILGKKEDITIEKNAIQKNLTIIYVCLSSPDLENQRSILIEDFKKRGIQVIPEGRIKVKDDYDVQIMTDLLEYADLIIHMIGGKYKDPDEDTLISTIEKEYDVISKFMNGDLKRTSKIHKSPVRLIWIPEHIIISDTLQSKFIERIKSNLKYYKGRTEIFTESYQQFKDYILSLLKPRIIHSAENLKEVDKNYIYLIHESSVHEEATRIANKLSEYSFKVVTTYDLSGQKNFIRAQKEAISNCDGIIVYYGLNNINWYQSIMGEILKISRTQRTQSFKVKAVIIESNTPQNLQRFDDFVYIRKESLSDLNNFGNQIKRMLG